MRRAAAYISPSSSFSSSMFPSFEDEDEDEKIRAGSQTQATAASQPSVLRSLGEGGSTLNR